LLGTKSLESVPADVPYLAAPKSCDAGLDSALNACQQRFRVGLVWSGNPKLANDRQRSIPIEMFRPVLSTPDVAFYSLQVGAAAERDVDAMREMGIVSLTEWLTDFADTAGAIERLDLVISVDTSVAHLAGALGKRVWTLVPTVSDWRWLRDRTDSVWYPTMRLFRQGSPGDWPEVLSRVADELVRYTS
jgi:hypothetical protein